MDPEIVSLAENWVELIPNMSHIALGSSCTWTVGSIFCVVNFGISKMEVKRDKMTSSD